MDLLLRICFFQTAIFKVNNEACKVAVEHCYGRSP